MNEFVSISKLMVSRKVKDPINSKDIQRDFYSVNLTHFLLVMHKDIQGHVLLIIVKNISSTEIGTSRNLKGLSLSPNSISRF